MQSSRLIRFQVQAVLLLFLAGNLVLRSVALRSHGVGLGFVAVSAVGLVGLVLIYPTLLRYLFLLLGLSLPLFGFQVYTFNSYIFEFLLLGIACLLFLQCLRERSFLLITDSLSLLLLTYVSLAICSLLLLPVTQYIETVRLWGAVDFFNAVSSALPQSSWYSLASVNRLVLFTVIAVLLSCCSGGRKMAVLFFRGCAVSLLLASVAGVANQAGLLSLEWYRPEFIDATRVARLHSVMGNPGWFAEYVIVSIPFLLLLLNGGWSTKLSVVLLLVALLLSGVSLILTASRASWILFPIAAGLSCLILLFNSMVQEESSVTWGGMGKKISRLGIIAGLCACVGAGILYAALFVFSPGDSPGIADRLDYLQQRLENITVPEERMKVWQETAAIINEAPVYGLGYESYRWHQGILDAIPESDFARGRLTSMSWETAHNLYLQILVSNGVLGLVVWILLVLYLFVILLRDGMVQKNRDSLLVCCFLCLFHLYGLAQAMQYLAPLWFMTFVAIGYGMRQQRESAAPKTWRLCSVPVVLAFVLVVSGFVVYGADFQSKSLAEKYDLLRYEVDFDQDLYRGFYQREDWGNDGFVRWSAKAGRIRYNKAGTVRIDFFCLTPALEQNPVTIDLSINGEPIGKIIFQQAGKQTRQLILKRGAAGAAPVLQVHVSRTWSPKIAGLGDDARMLGVAVGEPVYLRYP